MGLTKLLEILSGTIKQGNSYLGTFYKESTTYLTMTVSTLRYILEKKISVQLL